MQERLKHLRQLLTDQSLDAILISSLPNIFYLSNYNGFIPEERDGYVFVTKNDAYILTNILYSEAMPKAVPHLKLIEINRDNPLKKSLTQLVKKHKLKTIGFEANNLTVVEYNQLSTLAVKTIPADLTFFRMRKEAQEMASLQNAADLTIEAFGYIQKFLQPGITEETVSNALNMFFLENNAASAFRAVVAFGENTSVPHHLSGDRKLKKNDIILIDFGAKIANYCADVTRTFFFGKATKKQKEIYQLVYETQIYVQELIKVKLKNKERVSSFELDAAARKYIADRKYPPFPYSLGHGLGLEVHEHPLLNPRYDESLENDIVFTLEPGIHLPGEIGVRIEDMFVIKNNTLTQLSLPQTTLLEL